MKTGRPSTRALAPYHLRALLDTHHIPITELRAAIPVEIGTSTGQPIAASTLSRLLLHRQWPATTLAETIVDGAAAVLRKHDVPEREIQRAWTVDGDEPDAGPPFNRPGRVRVPYAYPVDDESTFHLPEEEMLTNAAREQFHLVRHPFVDDVQGPQDVYLSADQRYIRESMFYAAKHGGFVAVIGESGSGKSTLRRDLVERIRRDDEPIVPITPQTIDKKVLTAAHICDAIIADLSTETPRLSLEAKARQVQRILAASAHTGSSHVLIIEEAHDLSVATLKYLKRFWELEDGFRKLMGIILIGQPELGDRLDERRNYDAREVIRRCEIARLKPLDANLEGYIALKMKRIGVSPEALFDPDAYDAIRARLTRRRHGTNEVESQVYPLIVQNLIVRCLNQCAELGLPRISAELVERV